MHGVHTIHATIGDLFAWLCLAGLGIVTGLAVVQRHPVKATQLDVFNAGRSSTEKIQLAILRCFLHALSTVWLALALPIRIGGL